MTENKQDNYEFDVAKKKRELIQLWDDVFNLCRTTVENCKSGKQNLSGTLLKEITGFLKQSSHLIAMAEALEAEPERDQSGMSEEEKALLDEWDRETDANPYLIHGAGTEQADPVDFQADGFDLDSYDPIKTNSKYPGERR